MAAKLATSAAEGAQLPNGSHAEPPARSPARAALAKATARLDAANAALAAASEPVNRLFAVESRAVEIETRCKALAKAHSDALAAWIVDGAEGERPSPSPEQLAAEIELAQVAADVIAARKAMPVAQAAAQRCAEEVRAAAHDRDAALFTAAVEAAHCFFAGRYRTVLAEMLAHEDRLRGLELVLRGHQHPVAISAGGAVSDLLRNIGHALQVKPDPEPARRLLAALTRDPDATLDAVLA
jgi:hypothetical protein